MIMKKEIENTDDIKHVKEEGERKKNKKTMKNYEDNLSIKSTYLLMWELVRIAPVKELMIILLTMKVWIIITTIIIDILKLFFIKIAFATDSMTVLKIIEYGVPREKLGLLAVPLMPLQIILPLVISKYTNGPEPLTLLIKALPGR